MHRFFALELAAATFASSAVAADIDCENCAAWNAPQAPFRVFGNTYYVGTRGLASILVTSPRGHVLIDGALPQSAAQIEANVRALGFDLRDIKAILNTHAHFDHAGGIAALARDTGAAVYASAPSAAMLASGNPVDAQFGPSPAYPRVAVARTLHDGEVVAVGDLALTAHFTPGHTPGGTTWTWRACEQARCVHVVYADSLSAPGYELVANRANPHIVDDFRKSFATLAALPCELLLAPHPDLVALWQRLDASRSRGSDAFVDSRACNRYAASSRETLEKRIANKHSD